jgi:hypothetical protein
MLGATQAVLLGAAGCPLAGYAATVTGIPGLLAYWRCSSAGGFYDTTSGDRHGTFDGAVSLGPGLPSESDSASHLPGTVIATVPHDPGLALPALTLSLWVRLSDLPASKTAIVSKDQSGLFDGDFAITVDEDGELGAQFQSSSGESPIFHVISPDVVHHLVVRADETGFEFWVDGRHIRKETSFTAAWTNNSQDIIFASAPWSARILDLWLDEVALYNRALGDNEIIALSQRTADPVANGLSAVVDETESVAVDVASVSEYVGRKASLVIEVVDQAAFGVATVNAGNDIEFVASAVNADEEDSFTYRITDPNGTSNTATVDVEIHDATASGDGHGGTLVYQWTPLASWMTGSLAARNANAVKNLSNWTDPSAATVGSELPIGIAYQSGQNNFCFNYSPKNPAGATINPGLSYPAIETWTEPGQHYPMGFLLQLWPKMNSNPRHIRLAMDIKTSKSSDDTAHKSQGLGPTTGSYLDFIDSHSPGGYTDEYVSLKYMLATACGNGVLGAGSANWWNNYEFPCDRGYFSCVTASVSGDIRNYAYAFGRPASSRYGYGSALPSFASIDDVGVHGVWHRLEMDFKLATPGSVPDNARRSNPVTSPSQTGDGYITWYITKDIDGELGAPGERQLVTTATNLIQFCKFDDISGQPNGGDNMHILANPLGIFFYLFYGGSDMAQAGAHAWIRGVEVYHYTAEDLP